MNEGVTNAYGFPSAVVIVVGVIVSSWLLKIRLRQRWKRARVLLWTLCLVASSLSIGELRIREHILISLTVN